MKEFDATITVLRMFDEDIFVADLDPLIERTLTSESHFFTLLTHLSMSTKAKRQPDLILELSKKYQASLEPEQMRLFSDLASAAKDETTTTHELLRSLLWDLSPSAGPSLQFDYLRYELSTFLADGSGAPQLDELLTNYWGELRRRIHEEIVPKLKRFAELVSANKLSLEVKSQLHSRLTEVDSYLQVSEDLRSLILSDEDDEDLDERKTRVQLVEHFDGYVAGLQNLLCSDEPNTIHSALMGMVTEIRYLVRNIVNSVKIQDILDLYEVEHETILPEEACYVFCHSSDLALAVQNLIENIVHAFSGGDSSVRRVRIQVEARSNRACFIIKDSGKANFPVRPGIGLQKVDSIVSSLGGKFFYPRGISEPPFNTEVGFELIMIPEDLV